MGYAMCPDVACKLAPKCYRSPKSGRVANEHQQAWSVFWRVSDDECAGFMPVARRVDTTP